MGECFLKGFYIELLMIPPDGQTEALYRVHLIWFSYSLFLVFFFQFSPKSVPFSVPNLNAEY